MSYGRFGGVQLGLLLGHLASESVVDVLKDCGNVCVDVSEQAPGHATTAYYAVRHGFAAQASEPQLSNSTRQLRQVIPAMPAKLGQQVLVSHFIIHLDLDTKVLRLQAQLIRPCLIRSGIQKKLQ